MERIPGDKALVTTGLRFQSRHIKAFDTRQSKVFLIDLNNPDDEPKFVTIHNYPGNHSDLDFHGLSSWVDDQTGEVFVFLVNHLLTKSVVEIFQYIEDEVSLNHIRTCEDDSFHLLNDVVAVDKQSFYVTNYLYWRGSVASKIEMFLMLKWGSVLFYDGEKSRVVRDGLFMTNGINKSPDNR
ncbi:hypothetical protein LSH36_380g02042 [Paralvinella palmiformis]|uniref:Uncharacterized protein n=1 Tax=Paralvinella palmiformis TaxID=53620 RepID=A0AAD9JDQ5_9ANNE|nr:hypothetical protein LSH36_380g02042 [Paralvinella palmiformis]